MYLASSLKHSQIHDKSLRGTTTRSSMKKDALETHSSSAFTKRDNHSFSEENHDLISAAEIIKGNVLFLLHSTFSLFSALISLYKLKA